MRVLREGPCRVRGPRAESRSPGSRRWESPGAAPARPVLPPPSAPPGGRTAPGWRPLPPARGAGSGRARPPFPRCGSEGVRRRSCGAAPRNFERPDRPRRGRPCGTARRRSGSRGGRWRRCPGAGGPAEVSAGTGRTDGTGAGAGGRGAEGGAALRASSRLSGSRAPPGAGGASPAGPGRRAAGAKRTAGRPRERSCLRRRHRAAPARQPRAPLAGGTGVPAASAAARAAPPVRRRGRRLLEVPHPAAPRTVAVPLFAEGPSEEVPGAEAIPGGPCGIAHLGCTSSSLPTFVWAGLLLAREGAVWHCWRSLGLCLRLLVAH